MLDYSTGGRLVTINVSEGWGRLKAAWAQDGGQVATKMVLPIDQQGAVHVEIEAGGVRIVELEIA